MEAPFLAFTGGRPEKEDSWSWGCAHKEKKKVEVIEEELREIVRHGLDGVRVFHTLYRRRCGCTAARQTRTVRRRTICRTTRSGVALAGCCS